MVQAVERIDLPRIELPRSYNTNCVIAAIEDAFVAPATHDEKKLREEFSNRKDKQLKPFMHLAQTPEGQIALYKANLILETRAVAAFLKSLSNNRSPLGKAMSQYVMRQQNVSTEGLGDIINNDQITLIVQTSRNQEWHMMHARKLSSGRIVSGNDRDQEIRLQPTMLHLAYIFIRK